MTTPNLSRRSSVGETTAPPIYVGGLDRSGKTTLAAFLTSHPNIAIPPVGSNMWTYFYGQFGDLADWDNFESCLAAMLRYRHVSVLEPNTERIRRQFAAGPRTYGRLFSLIMSQYAERLHKPRWGVQSGLVERFADQLTLAYGQVKLIHMVRDPRDRYAGSLELWPNGKGRAGGAAARWNYSMRLATRNQRRYGNDYLIVRYEDLVLNTEGELRRICDFVGEDFEAEMLTMSGNPERRDRLMRKAARSGGEILSSEFIGRGRDLIPRQELAFIELHARRGMRALGYLPPVTDLTASERLSFVASWPSQALRMLAWRGREELEQRFPRQIRRSPNPREIETAEAA